MQKIIIFTDGASKGNPGRGGWGAIVASEHEVVELGGFEANTTNNRMELSAISEALTYAKKFKSADIELYTDSSYVIKGVTEWSKGWQARRWVTKQKTSVLNRDLWEPLLQLVENSNKIVWHNVGGHIGIMGNERADSIADGFALGKSVQLYRGPRSSYTVDVTDLSHDPELHAQKSASRARSKHKAYSYVSEVSGEVKVHKTWDECAARVRGKKARFKKALSAAEESEIVRKFGSH